MLDAPAGTVKPAAGRTPPAPLPRPRSAPRRPQRGLVTFRRGELRRSAEGRTVGRLARSAAPAL